MGKNTPMRYRKRPVVIEAMEVQPPWKNVIDWIGETAWILKASSGRAGVAVMIDTLEGTMRADLGDWIIKGVAGEFYPCKPEIFKATYEAVE